MNLVKIVTQADIESLDEKLVIDQFNELVNQDPPPEIVKDHWQAPGVKYIPIDKIEILLTKLFQDWYVEILREGQLAQSVFVTVRLHYYHPVHKKWRFQDGTGAVDIQTGKGKSAADLISINPGAIMKGLPAAKSFAIKDAAEHIGKLFGRDLNRKDTIAFTGEYSKDDSEKKKAEMRNKVRNQNASS